MSIKSRDVRYLAQLITSSIDAICLHQNHLNDFDKIMLCKASCQLQKISGPIDDSNLAEVTLESPNPAINFGSYS